MTDVQVLEIIRGALDVAARVSAPILVTALVVGVMVSILQTITQIQEMTLTFVPKLVGIALVLLVLGGWMLEQLVGWVTDLWGRIPALL